jgi:hypothetical protein
MLMVAFSGKRAQPAGFASSARYNKRERQRSRPLYSRMRRKAMRRYWNEETSMDVHDTVSSQRVRNALRALI